MGFTTGRTSNTYANTLAVIRHHLSSYVGDWIGGTFASGSTTTGVHTMLTKGDDYYNEHGYRCYIHTGTNIGAERKCSDWVNSTNTLTFDPAFTSAIDNTSQYELAYKFTEDEKRQAINLAIESTARSYYIWLADTTTIKLTSTEDNLSDTVYTWEYALPTDCQYLWRITTEEAVSGVKLTGTVSGVFTNGETITGGTSGATGELAYGPAGGTYIRVRKVSGTFVVGETATGGTSGETCSAITAVESESSGNNRWLEKDIIDPRLWRVLHSDAPKLKLEKRGTIDEDLYLRLEYQGSHPRVSADTDVIYLPPDWLVMKAVTYLPASKIVEHELQATLSMAKDNIRTTASPKNYPHPEARKVYE